MNRPSRAHLLTASRLLAFERDSGSNAAPVKSAAGRVYEQLDTHLTPLLGIAGVQALMARSLKVACVEVSDFDAAAPCESSTKLRGWLETQDIETVTTVLATFCELLTTFIGGRLTFELLRRAWPDVEDLTASEATQ